MTAVPPPSQPTVDAIWRAREAAAADRPEYMTGGISASLVGNECDRALFYELRWVSEPERFTGRTLRIFERGDIEEQRVYADLRAAGVKIDEQAEFAAVNGFLRGRADGIATGILEAPTARHVLEIKSAKAADWRAVQKHGVAKAKPLHWHQLHAGMSCLGIDRGFYVMVNKDSEEILTERIHLDPEVAGRQEARVARIVDAHDAPGRVSDDPEAFGCRFCKHREVCHTAKPARRTCRSCLHWSFTRDGLGHCERFDRPMRRETQAEACPAHLYLPTLVAGEQIDADPEAETITYVMHDGTTWIDGGEHATP